MSGFEIRGTVPGSRVTVIPPVSRAGKPADDGDRSPHPRFFQTEAGLSGPVLPTPGAFVAQLLGGRHDFPQARRRRRAEPGDGAEAYRSGLGLAGAAPPATVSRLV
jgi:hypothetical protein